jgi:pyruvate/2-oxoglutarate dehydrogenase complex dihydrolipoamide acyltransferase (E2) component
MESLVVDIFKKVGDTVEKGAPLAIVSAMKLETNISAEASGVIKEIHCKAGDQVSSDDILFVLATDGGSAPASEISEAETVSSQNDRGIWEDLKEDNASHPLVNEFYTRVNATLEAENFHKFRDQHAKRNKFLPRERIARVCDPGTHFLELSLLSHGKDDTHTELPSGGIVTGIGIVHGKHFVFVANDPTIKGGTYAPITVKKTLESSENC